MAYGRIQRGRTSPLKNHKNIGFPSNIGADPIKITKLPSQHLMLGHHRHASKTPFKWRCCRADDGPLIVVFGYSLPSSKIKKIIKVGPPLTKLFLDTRLWPLTDVNSLFLLNTLTLFGCISTKNCIRIAS